MKILFISKFLPSHFQNILMYHTLSGENEIQFVSEFKHNDFNIKGVNYTNIRFPRVHFKGSKLQQSALRFVRRSHNFARALQRIKDSGFIPDIIYTETSSAASLNLREVYPDTPCIGFCDWYLSDPTELKFNDEEENTLLDLSVYLKINNMFFNEMLNLCTKLVTFSNTQKNSFPKNYQKKLSVAYHGINTSFIKPDKNKFTTPLIENFKDKEFILYATQCVSLSPQFKNAMIAVKEVMAKNPNTAFALLSYDKKSSEENIDAFSFTQSLLDEFKGRTVYSTYITREEYKDALNSAAVQLVINPNASLSVGLFEALSAGAILLSRDDIPYFSEFIIDKQTGYLADFSKTNEITQAIEKILINKEENKSISEKARKVAINHFSLEAEVKKLLKIEASLLSKNTDQAES